MLTYVDALTGLTLAVLKNGTDFRYSDGIKDCIYIPLNDERVSSLQKFQGFEDVPDSDPRKTSGCLVGTALDITKNLTDEIATAECGVEALVHKGYLKATAKARILLREAQNAQDNGYTWGEALQAAIEYVASLYWADEEHYEHTYDEN